jgi:hypothetical protein
MCSQLSTIDEARDLRQILACDVDQKERGFDAVALRKILIWEGTPSKSMVRTPARRAS